jgi:hypothetical protein
MIELCYDPQSPELPPKDILDMMEAAGNAACVFTNKYTPPPPGPTPSPSGGGGGGGNLPVTGSGVAAPIGLASVMLLGAGVATLAWSRRRQRAYTI